jgi:hypothetical protein
VAMSSMVSWGSPYVVSRMFASAFMRDTPPGCGPAPAVGASSRVRPNARDQSSKSPFLWSSDVAVQPDCQRRQQRRGQWEGFTYHDSKDSFRRQMIFAAT